MLRTVSLGVALLLVLAGMQVAPPSAAPTDNAPAVADTTSALGAADASAERTRLSPTARFADTVFETMMLGLIMVIVLGIVGAFIGGVAAVSIFMDTGCLRFIVFGLGWVPACFVGFLIGIVLGEATGAEWFLSAGAQLGFFGYPAAWAWGLQHAKQLPHEEYVTWKYTLTGAALLGAGVGSVLTLTRSAAVLFKGGGGSFGGGGASGSFGSAATAGSAATGSAATGSAATGSATAVAGSGTAPSGPVAARVVRGAAAVSHAAAQTAAPGRLRGTLQGIGRRLRMLRWYHGIAFVLTVLIFLPVGLGAAAWMHAPKVLIAAATVTVGTGLYRRFRRGAVTTGPDAPGTAPRVPFRGGGAASPW